MNQLRRSHFTAQHHCYAYVIGLKPQAFKAYDDGEPGHSAGDPILGQIRSMQLTDVMVVVVRYFGGTKLGVGGLVNAYKSAAAAALSQSELVDHYEKIQFNILYSYERTHLLLDLLRNFEPEILEKKFEQDCSMLIAIQKEWSDSFREKIQLNDFTISLVP